MKASCNVTVSIDFISVNSIEQAVLEGVREAGKKLFLAFLELIEKTPSKERIGNRCTEVWGFSVSGGDICE